MFDEILIYTTEKKIYIYIYSADGHFKKNLFR